MGKRKTENVENEEPGFEKDDLSTGNDSEDEVSASGGQSESGEEDLSESEDSGEELSLGEEEDEDPIGRDEQEQEHEQDAPGSTAFSRAFGRVMKKRVLESAITEISGPVLAEQKQLLVRKFEEAESQAKAKTSGNEEKREIREKGHLLPLTYTDVKEKALTRLATKGVVRLFNAVSKAQAVQADADLSSGKVAKATWKQSKAVFMTELRASSKSGLKESEADGSPVQDGKEAEPGWAALGKDFILGTSQKFIDWDQGVGDSGQVASN